MKWNLTKFDFSRTLENDLNWCIPTVRNTPTSGPWNSGTSPSSITIQPLSTPRSTHYLSPHQTPWEETLNTRNNSKSFWNKQTTSQSAPSTGILWKVPKQNPDQAVPFPHFLSPHHLHLRSQFVGVELTSANATIAQTLLPHRPTLNCGNPLRICYPEEEYITRVTTALQNLASRSRAMSREGPQDRHPLRCSEQVIPQRNNQTVSETDLTQQSLPPLPFIQRPINPNWIAGTTQSESPEPTQRSHSLGAVEVTGFPPRPFLPKHIYLSTTIPSRNRDKQLAFIRHCRYLQQNRPSIEFTHTLTELHLLMPSPSIFAGFLWRYKIYINQNGILEDYRVIIVDNQGMRLEKRFTVFHSWDRRGFSVNINA